MTSKAWFGGNFTPTRWFYLRKSNAANERDG